MSGRRIVVDLESGIARRDLEAAAALAGRVGAELVGLFIEDADLLQFAALPFAHEICFASASRRRLDPAALERTLRARAAEAERALASSAGQASVRWSFRVVRGFAAQELLSAAIEAFGGSAAEEIRLLLLGDGESPARRWAEQAGLLAAREPALRVRVVHALDVADLHRALRDDGSGVLLLRGDPAELSQPALDALLRETAAPVLILPASARRRAAAA